LTAELSALRQDNGPANQFRASNHPERSDLGCVGGKYEIKPARRKTSPRSTISWNADRASFEIVETNPMEVSPGVFLTIKDTDVGKQQISGWLYIEAEHRTMWLRGQSVLNPIGFYNSSDARQKRGRDHSSDERQRGRLRFDVA
jgi:hypothetical protein